MTPVERLRAAEVLVRERAEKATNGKWRAVSGWVEVAPDFDLHRFDAMPTTVARADQSEDDATYIAMMSPPVALAMADWLAHEARVREESDRQKVYFPFARATQSDALADALLGGGGA